MFLRVKTSPSGQCLQLLESYRNALGKPSHRVVVSLGDAQIPEADRAMVARMVSQRLHGQEELLPETKRSEVLNWVDGIAKRVCLLYTSPSPRDRQKSRMPSSA